MTKFLLFAVLSLTVSSTAFAQEFAAVVGVHQTDADTDDATASVDGVMNFKAGLGVRFQLMENSYFRTGVLYNQRHFEVKSSGAASAVDYNFDYLDIPATYQFNVNEMFGLFGGLVVAVNINDDVDTTPSVDPDADTLIPLATLGATLMFDDMIGFDFYYERGLGSFAEDLETFSSFGANFNYWF
jgi:hypothetical protein